MLDLLFITIIIVYGVDLSGALDSLSSAVWKWMYPKVPYSGWRIPLFGCSLCSSWWCGLLYLFVTGTFSWLMVLYVAMLSFFTPVIGSILMLVKDVCISLIDALYKLFS